jgi:hypothetical protein
MRFLTLLTALALLPTATKVSAQDIVPLAPGQRVRVTAPTISSTRIVGAYTHGEADTLVIASHGRTWRFPRSSVTALDVGRGQKSNVGKGALYGSLLGAGIGALALGSSSLCADLEAAGTCTVVGAGGGAVGGLLVGAIVGALIKTERWEEVPLDRLHLTFMHWDDRSFLFATSISF